MELHSGDFSVTVRDVRQLNQPEGDLLTLLWVLEGAVTLTEADVALPLGVDALAIVNRNRRWSLSSAASNAVMILTLSASWLARLDSAFFAVDYQITSRTRDAQDGLRHLMRQLLVSGLVNHPGHSRLEANRWLSEIALLLATRFSQPIASMPRRDAEPWSRRIASVVARIDANYQRAFHYRRWRRRNLSPRPGCPGYFAKRWASALSSISPRCVCATRQTSCRPPANRSSKLPANRGLPVRE